MAQEECWQKDGRTSKGTWVVPIPTGTVTRETHHVSTFGPTSTVQAHLRAKMPRGPATINVVMKFSLLHNAIHRATMTGAGGVTFAGDHELDETFKATGYWLAGNCPFVLPPAHQKVLKQSQLPGLDALKRLDRPLEAKYPQARGP